MKSARQVAAEALLRVERGGYSQLVLDAALRNGGLDARDAAFASALFYGTLERRVTLDHCIARYARRPIGDVVAVLLREAFFQLLYLESVPPHAAVDEAVELCRAMRQARAAGMVNGILRSFLRDGAKVPPVEGPPAARLAIEGSCSEDLAADLIDWYGEETARAILSASFGRPPVFARVNPLKTTAEALCARLGEEGCEAAKTDLEGCIAVSGPAAQTAAHAEGLFHIQDRCAQQAALALGAKPGDRVLDLCAAPGSKSFTIAEQMENRGEILACDIAEGRLRQVEKGAARLGITILRTRCGDGAVPADLGAFDRVLCDVPCSGLGVLRRKPEIKLRGRASWQNLPETQYRILRAGANYVTEGGVLVYATCTINPAENEGIVERFLAQNGGFLPEKTATELPTPQGGDGFFIARLRRKG